MEWNFLGNKENRNRTPQWELVGVGLENRTIEKRNIGEFSTELAISATSPTLSQKLSMVYACVELISNTIGKTGIKLFQTKDKVRTEVKNHPVLDVINFPNQVITHFTLFKSLMESVLLHGNGYAIIKRDRNNNPISLQFVPSSLVTIIVDNEFLPSEIKYNVLGKGIVEHTEMIHITNKSLNGVRGISTLSYAADSLGIALSAEESAGNFFEGGGNVSGIISLVGAVDASKGEAIKQGWRNGIINNKNGVAIMGDGADFKPITISPKDSQLLESREFDNITIARFFGVLPQKVNAGKDGYKTIESAQIAFLTDTMSHWFTRIEEELNRKVFKPTDRGRLKLDFDSKSLFKYDIASLGDYLTKMLQNAVINANEARAELGYEPYEGGNQYTRLANQIPTDVINEVYLSKLDKSATPNPQE